MRSTHIIKKRRLTVVKWLIVLSMLLSSMVACTTKLEQAQIEKGFQSAGLPTDFKYEIVYIESMPCVFLTGYKRAGLSCDWRKWDAGVVIEERKGKP